MRDNHFSTSTDRIPHRLANCPPSLFNSDIIAASYPIPNTESTQRLSNLAVLPAQPLHSSAGEVTRRNTLTAAAEHDESVSHTTTAAATRPAFRLTRTRVVSGDVDAKHQGIIDSLLFRFAPVGVQRALRTRKRSIVVDGLVVLLLALFVFFDEVYDLILIYHSRPPSAAAAEVWGTEEFDAPKGALAVLVQHTDAMARLNITMQEECAFGSIFCNGICVSPQLLPSWTLHTVDPHCSTCTDTQTYMTAIKRVAKLSDERAVFATTPAPLGRIGPMLFAISNMTDDVDVAMEVQQWSWMRHVYADFTKNLDETVPAVVPYLAVMGVPSVDQRGRDALRAAQRATWLSYSEVARHEKGFYGALLPLSLFSATDAAETANMGAMLPNNKNNNNKNTLHGNNKGNTTCSPYLYVNGYSIAPTMRKFEYATQARAAAMDNEESVRYTHRHVQLRANWRHEDIQKVNEGGKENDEYRGNGRRCGCVAEPVFADCSDHGGRECSSLVVDHPLGRDWHCRDACVCGGCAIHLPHVGCAVAGGSDAPQRDLDRHDATPTCRTWETSRRREYVRLVCGGWNEPETDPLAPLRLPRVSECAIHFKK